MLAYAATAVMLSGAKDWVETGPLAFGQPALEEPLDGAIALDRALNACFPLDARSASAHYKVVGGYVEGRPDYACYEYGEPDQLPGPTVQVVQGDGTRLEDARVFKLGGAWPQHALVASLTGFVVGGGVLLALLGFGIFYYRRPPERIPRTTRWWGRPQILWLVATLVPVASWLAVALWLKVPWARGLRALMQVTLFYAVIVILTLLLVAAAIGDSWAAALFGSLVVAIIYGIVAGRRLLLAPHGPGRQHRVTVGSRLEDAAGRQLRGARRPLRQRPA